MGFALNTANKPVYNGTPQTVADLQAAVDYASIFANIRVGTTTQMNALAGAQLFTGAYFSNTTDGGLYRYEGGWKRVGGKFLGVKVRRAAAQPVATGAFVNLAWDTEVFDTAALWSSGAPANIVVPAAGVYLVNINAGFATGFSGRIALQLVKNGTIEFGGQLIPSGSAAEAGTGLNTHVSCAAGDTLVAQVYQESGSSQNTGGSGYSQPTMSVSWQGAV